MTKPGELTREYAWGNRKRFLTPIKLFLLCNLIYFVAAAQFPIGVLTVPLRVQTGQMMYQGVARAMVDEHLHMEAPAMTLEERAARDSVKTVFATKYDGATLGIGKVIVAALIPLCAIAFQILYVGRRRFFAEHLILSTHMTAFLLVAIAGLGVIAAGAQRLAGAWSLNNELLFSTFFSVAFVSYSYVAQRVAYETDRMGAAIRTGLFAIAMVPILTVLKFILFVVTLHWVS